MKSVYIETSIISYLVARPSRDVVVLAHQELTRQWWNEQRDRFELFVSRLVLDEAARGDPETAARRLEAIRGVPVLPITQESTELAQCLIEAHALPSEAADDAFHVALATRAGIDLLLTWNCKHIANPEKTWLIEETIRQAGLAPPTICTPDELVGGSYEE